MWILVGNSSLRSELPRIPSLQESELATSNPQYAQYALHPRATLSSLARTPTSVQDWSNRRRLVAQSSGMMSDTRSDISGSQYGSSSISGTRNCCVGLL